MRRTLAAIVALLALAPATASASTSQETWFQDDDRLLYSPPETVLETLDTIKALGADRLRITLLWKSVAPDVTSQSKPAGFDPNDPNAYPPGSWGRYDTVLREARARGLDVNFDVSGPAPMWATGNPERADIDETYDPSTSEFEAFVKAAGRRYDGSFPDGNGGTIPRVDHWSIWNEPNQPGWLTPQWLGAVEASPRIYRGLVTAAFNALGATGHGSDTILLGETAPKGVRAVGETRAISPARFIRRLYCLDDANRPLAGDAATQQGCPASGNRDELKAQHPALFNATGWGHHPYELTFAPSRKPTDKEFFTMANLRDLHRLLDTAIGRAVPLWLTEFGYQTSPPDPAGVTFARQQRYLDEAEYLASRDRRVRSLGQFLLVDDDPLPGVPTDSLEAWGSSFQSGLVMIGGRKKSAFSTFATPVHLPSPALRRAGRLRVFGLARAAGSRPLVDVLVRTRGSKRERRVARVRANASGYLSARVRVTRSGSVRLRYKGADGKSRSSRRASFTVRRR